MSERREVLSVLEQMRRDVEEAARILMVSPVGMTVELTPTLSEQITQAALLVTRARLMAQVAQADMLINQAKLDLQGYEEDRLRVTGELSC